MPVSGLERQSFTYTHRSDSSGWPFARAVLVALVRQAAGVPGLFGPCPLSEQAVF